jgi:hypothetical protein
MEETGGYCRRLGAQSRMALRHAEWGDSAGLTEKKDVKMPLSWCKMDSIWVESVIF